jgi:flagella synthesis protein FlgN
MPSEPLSERNLNQLLDEQIDAMQAVLEALETERAALAARNGDALVQAVDRKAASIAAADVLEDRRQALLEQLGLPGRPGGAAGRVMTSDSGMAQRWQQVLALTRQCRAVNEANGQLIRGQRRRTAETLRLMRGESAATAEYGPAGDQRPSRGTPRSLASI